MSTPLAITMGDPAGIGPEIVLRALPQRPTRGPRWLWIGDPELLSFTARELGLPAPLEVVATPEAAAHVPRERLAVLPTRVRAELSGFRFGQPQPEHAAATVESIQSACRLALAGRVAGLVTPPINKGVLHRGGFDVPGHTELLAHCCGVEQPVMMLAGKGLRVVPATIHTALSQVPRLLTRPLLEGIIETTLTALQRDFGLSRPRIAVTGLNPHAGENGAFGDEELRLIAPLVAELAARHREAGITLRGPLPADSLFHPAARATYDAVVCMYHDQALIPLKTLAFGQAVNATLGLPIVRTSVDHGTAYDIAGQGIADPRSLLAAARLADAMARNRRRGDRAHPAP